jgi:hypothetical protein
MARRAPAVLGLSLLAVLAVCTGGLVLADRQVRSDPGDDGPVDFSGSVRQVAWLSPDITAAVVTNYDEPPRLWWARAGGPDARVIELPRAEGPCDFPAIVTMRRLDDYVLILAVTCGPATGHLLRFDVAAGELHPICVAAADPCPVPAVPWADPGAWPARSSDGRVDYLPGADGVYVRTDRAAEPVLLRGGLTKAHDVTVFTRGEERLIAVCALQGLFVLRTADGSVVRHWVGDYHAVAASPDGDRLLVPDLRVMQI